MVNRPSIKSLKWMNSSNQSVFHVYWYFLLFSFWNIWLIYCYCMTTLWLLYWNNHSNRNSETKKGSEESNETLTWTRQKSVARTNGNDLNWIEEHKHQKIVRRFFSLCLEFYSSFRLLFQPYIIWPNKLVEHLSKFDFMLYIFQIAHFHYCAFQARFDRYRIR